jgi:hypothetical protein
MGLLIVRSDMRGHAIFGSALVLLPAAIGTLPQESAPLDSAALRAMIVGLGFEVKDLSTEVGKEKYELVVVSGGYNVPIGAELSPSRSYIWFTASLGQVNEKTKWEQLLRANGKIQPTQFYVTSSNFLMIGLTVENHGVTPVWLKKSIDKVASDTASQAAAWRSDN